MNFIKLLPILFLGLSDSGLCKPLEPQILPSVPGYVPVYIQTGNVPPDVEALYQARKVAEIDQTGSETEHKEVTVKDDMKKEEVHVEEAQHPQEEQHVDTKKEEQTKEDVQQVEHQEETKPPKNSASEEKSEEVNKSSESKEENQKEDGSNSGSVRKVNQYQVNESNEE